ncbi:helix-turn-helix domain-containing protein [Herminiimonas sp. KBW02]|uniref:winged helix-turn-helix transcriptional regulator n=1 Tax=Herminiimonas sp. KBW02 TaxID=2153363 RepID=UPI001F1C27AD|nr:helix-turn-helix domain-containing protein [Herminiimonas sp. KBW02]
MPGKITLQAEPCPVARALDVIGDRWSLLIVRNAFDGMGRFGDFQKGLGIAKNILSDRLHKLQLQGILEAVPATDGSAYQDYVLTAKGEALFTLIVSLRQWGEEYLFDKNEPRSLLLEKQSGKAIPKMEARSANGRKLNASNTLVRKIDR